MTGKVYTDGALRGRHPEARRAGWAFALIEDGSLRLKAAYYGVCGELWLTVLRAELYAIEQAIRRAVAPLTIYTDSSSAVKSYFKGQKYCCSAKAEGADIWRRIWAMLADFGSFHLEKVKAHTTASDVAEGLISAQDQAGNAAADHFAVEARKAAEASSPIGKFEAHYARARAWYKSVLASIAHWEEDTFADAEHAAPTQSEEVAVRSNVGQPRRHEIWECGHAWVCRSCGKAFHLHCLPGKLAKGSCKGSMHARLLISMGVAVPPESFDCFTAQELLDQGGRRWCESSEEQGTSVDHAVPPAATVRRRLVGKQPDPLAQPRGGSSTAVREYFSGHILVKAGNVTYCDRCGRWAIDRFGPGLLRKCSGSVNTTLGAYRVRRDRLRSGRHPLTNQPL